MWDGLEMWSVGASEEKVSLVGGDAGTSTWDLSLGGRQLMLS